MDTEQNKTEEEIYEDWLEEGDEAYMEFLEKGIEDLEESEEQFALLCQKYSRSLSDFFRVEYNH